MIHSCIADNRYMLERYIWLLKHVQKGNLHTHHIPVKFHVADGMADELRNGTRKTCIVYIFTIELAVAARK